NPAPAARAACHPINCILNANAPLSTDRIQCSEAVGLAVCADTMLARKELCGRVWMSAQRLFEMRTYYPAPGRMEALENRFRHHTMRLFARHGITSVGYWKTFGADDLRLIYILAYPDLDSRERSWTQFRADPEWQAA